MRYAARLRELRVQPAALALHLARGECEHCLLDPAGLSDRRQVRLPRTLWSRALSDAPDASQLRLATWSGVVVCTPCRASRGRAARSPVDSVSSCECRAPSTISRAARRFAIAGARDGRGLTVSKTLLTRCERHIAGTRGTRFAAIESVMPHEADAPWGFVSMRDMSGREETRLDFEGVAKG